ncbi:hypothetical protein [Clostridium sardiniense]|uniref:hypothetical protein n=1 Tax=Clostridium sardiniense TaxID=29369 RepID=UPI00195DE3B2|nr:hypothetical protein [Clostridium sardiniense]MBM7835711.1 myosin heavy subunit [Clostridium sardiniense]
MENAKDLEKVKEKSNNSINSAQLEQKAYMDSLKGKINALKETWKGLTMDLANTDFLKGMIGGATGVLNVVKKLVDTFGALPSILASVTAGFMLFSDKFRKRIEENVWGMDKLKGKFDEMIKKRQDKIIDIQGERNADGTIKQAGAIDKLSQSYKNGEKSVISYGTSMIALQGKLAATKVAMIATRGAALLLESALSFGIALIASFVIEKAIEGFSKLQKSIHMTKSQLADFNAEYIKNADASSKQINEAENNLSKMEKIKQQMADTKNEQERAELQKQLIDLQRQMADTFPETYTGLDKEGKKLATNNEIIRQQIDLKKEAARTDALDFFKKNKSLEKDLQGYKKQVKEFKDLQKDLENGETVKAISKTGNGRAVAWARQGTDDLKKMQKEMSDTAQKAEGLRQAIQAYRSAGKTDYDINNIAGFNAVGALKDYENSLKDVNKSSEEAKGGTNDFGNGLMDLQDKAEQTEKQIKSLKDAFDGFASEEKVIKDAMDEFQKTGKLSEDMISKILGTNDNKLIASLGDANSMLSVMKGRLRDVGKEKINAYHSAVDEAVIAQQRENSVAAQGANNRSQIAQDEANNKNSTYNDDVNNQTTAEDNKTQNAAVGANNRSGITNNEINNKSGSYATDVGNHSNAEGTKGQNAASTSDFIFARYNNLVNGLGVGYGTDVTNHGNAGDAKGEKTSGVVNSIVGMHDQMANNLSGVYGTDVTNYSNALSSKLSATSQFVSQTMRMYNSLKPGQEMKIGDTKVYSAGDPRGIWLLADAEAHRQEKEREKVGPLRDGGGGFTPIQGDSSYTPISSNYSPRSSGGGRRSSYKPKKSSYKPSKSSSGGGGKGSSGKSSSSTNSVNIEDIDEKIDRYKSLQDALNDVNNALDENATREELANNKDRIKYINNEIGLYRKKKNAIDDIIGAKQKEARELERQLNSKGLHAHNGDIDNYTKALEDAKARVNRMANTDKSKEKAKKDFKELEDAANRYFELTSSELPKLKKEWIEVDKAIKDSRKKFIDMMADTERQVTEVIKNEIENRKKAWEKETDKRREEVQKQKDLYDNKNKNEDFEEELAEKQKKLHEINSKIESVRRDLSAEGQSKLKDYLKEQEDAQKDLNKFIRDKQREDADKAFDDQMDKIDKIKDEKEKALDENYTDDKIAELAKGMIQKGFVEIEGHVIKLRDAISGYYKDQGELFADSSLKMQEFIDKLEATKNLYSELNKMNKDLGVQDINRINNAGRTVIEMPKIPVPISMMAMPASKNIDIKSDLHIGTLNESKPEDVRKMLDENNRELMKKIREENGIY